MLGFNALGVRQSIIPGHISRHRRFEAQGTHQVAEKLQPQFALKGRGFSRAGEAEEAEEHPRAPKNQKRAGCVPPSQFQACSRSESRRRGPLEIRLRADALALGEGIRYSHVRRERVEVLALVVEDTIYVNRGGRALDWDNEGGSERAIGAYVVLSGYG